MYPNSKPKNCPASLNVKCENCPWQKETLCDYPYIGAERIPIEEALS